MYGIILSLRVRTPKQAAIAQSVVRILGKDEVTSSILVSSFQKTLNYKKKSTFQKSEGAVFLPFDYYLTTV